MPWQKDFNEQFIKALAKVAPSKQEFKLSGNLTLQALSKILTWDEFEKLAALIMEKNGFEVLLNYRVKKKEIDVLARNSRYLIGIDCKHWKRMGRSMLSRAAQMQKIRVRLALESFNGLTGIAAIVTLYETSEWQVDGIPVVPINKLISFVNDLDGYVGQIDTMGP
ncbi:MAG: restriction endonuclease [Conexivisphaerales archaeon]